MVGSDVGTVEVARCGCVGCVAGRCGVLGLPILNRRTLLPTPPQNVVHCVSPLHISHQ